LGHVDYCSIVKFFQRSFTFNSPAHVCIGFSWLFFTL